MNVLDILNYIFGYDENVGRVDISQSDEILTISITWKDGYPTSKVVFPNFVRRPVSADTSVVLATFIRNYMHEVTHERELYQQLEDETQQLYIGLFTADGKEVSYEGYERQAINLQAASEEGYPLEFSVPHDVYFPTVQESNFIEGVSFKIFDRDGTLIFENTTKTDVYPGGTPRIKKIEGLKKEVQTNG